eukprot:GGOE01006011.1.p2 GENE.GGOE01006011.1~~GGOE01006011.1.p2  ORF type:complete len:120 (-),score=4.18 GGOE01006011.1:122-481(-)
MGQRFGGGGQRWRETVTESMQVQQWREPAVAVRKAKRAQSLCIMGVKEEREKIQQAYFTPPQKRHVLPTIQLVGSPKGAPHRQQVRQPSTTGHAQDGADAGIPRGPSLQPECGTAAQIR